MSRTLSRRKLALLQRGRWLEFHHQSGRHYRLRIPKEGRDLAYQPSTCDLLLACSGPEVTPAAVLPSVVLCPHQVYRLNLQSGMFSLPLHTSMDSGVNVIQVNPQHELIGLGGINGWVECWDSRPWAASTGG